MNYKAIVIGGSAGSFQLVSQMLHAMPDKFPLPILMCLHRLKHIRSGFMEAIAIKSNLHIVEPYDKQIIRSGEVYLAPANYHMAVEFSNTIALSIEEPLNHSRPSIDILFSSAAYVYRENLIAILLSGANIDGANGLKEVHDLGGLTIVQDPGESEFKTMPEAALQLTQVNHVYKTEEIINFMVNLTKE